MDFDAKGWRDVRDRSEGEPANQCGGAGTTCPAPSQNGAIAVTMANNFNNEIQFAMLPLGFLKMALEKNATVSKEKKDTVLRFPMEDGTAYKTNVKGYINDQGLVEKVETMIDNGMLGDTKWEATFSNYKDFGGVKFPTSIVQRQGGPKILEMAVADVKVNQPVDLTPPAGRGGRGLAARVAQGQRRSPEWRELERQGWTRRGKGWTRSSEAADAAPRLKWRAKIWAAASGWSPAVTAP